MRCSVALFTSKRDELVVAMTPVRRRLASLLSRNADLHSMTSAEWHNDVTRATLVVAWRGTPTLVSSLMTPRTTTSRDVTDAIDSRFYSLSVCTYSKLVRVTRQHRDVTHLRSLARSLVDGWRSCAGNVTSHLQQNKYSEHVGVARFDVALKRRAVSGMSLAGRGVPRRIQIATEELCQSTE